MIKEFGQWLLNVREPIVIGETDKETKHLLGDGAVVSSTKPVPPRRHQCETLDSFVGASVDFADGAVIWASFNWLSCVLMDLADRHDRCRMELSPSEIFDALERQRIDETDVKRHSHRDLVQFLKFDLHAARFDPENVVNLVSELTFHSSADTTGKIKNDDHAVSQSLRQKVSGADKLPEFVTVSFAPYPALDDELDAEVQVGCHLRLYAEENKLALAPLPGQLEQARMGAQKTVAGWIEEKLEVLGQGRSISVFCGRP